MVRPEFHVMEWPQSLEWREVGMDWLTDVPNWRRNAPRAWSWTWIVQGHKCRTRCPARLQVGLAAEEQFGQLKMFGIGKCFFSHTSLFHPLCSHPTRNGWGGTNWKGIKLISDLCTSRDLAVHTSQALPEAPFLGPDLTSRILAMVLHIHIYHPSPVITLKRPVILFFWVDFICYFLQLNFT